MESIEVKEELNALKNRMSALEQEQHKIDIQLVSIKSDLFYLRAGQDNLNSNLSKFLWIIGGGLLASIVSWVLKGGLI
jgi:predicted  nucleic acid-binding Zn-ribbon protein